MSEYVNFAPIKVNLTELHKGTLEVLHVVRPTWEEGSIVMKVKEDKMFVTYIITILL